MAANGLPFFGADGSFCCQGLAVKGWPHNKMAASGLPFCGAGDNLCLQGLAVKGWPHGVMAASSVPFLGAVGRVMNSPSLGGMAAMGCQWHLW